MEQVLIPDNAGTAIYRQDPEEWKKQLLNYIRISLLSRTGAEEDVIAILTDEEAAPHWYKVFTHKSFNPNNGENYERSEKMGDKVMDISFDDFMLDNFPDTNESKMGDARNFYMSKTKQAKISDDFGFAFDQWTLSNIGIGTSIKEDVLEALFGAIYRIGKMKYDPGTGYILANNFFLSLYQDTISTSKFRDPPRTAITEVKELLEKTGWVATGAPLKEIEVISDDPEYGHTYNLKWTPIAMEWFKVLLSPDQYEIIRKNPYFASKTHPNKKSAKHLAYEEGLINLRKIITPEFSETVRQLKERDELAPYREAAKEKAIQNGYSDVQLSKETKLTDIMVLQLYGITDDPEFPVEGRRTVLVTKAARLGTPSNELAQSVYEAYINN